MITDEKVENFPFKQFQHFSALEDLGIEHASSKGSVLQESTGALAF